MKKIAITGVDPQDRQMLSNALSYIIGYDVVRQTAYSSQAIKYGLNKEIKNSNWQELFVYTLSSFSERIEAEQQFDTFISNGSVFNELAHMKAIRKNMQNQREDKESLLMISGLERIIAEYAEKEYQCIIHINRIDEEDLQNQKVDDCLLNLIQNSKIKNYSISKNTILTEILEQIITELGLRMIISPQTALDKAQKDMLVIKSNVFNQQNYSNLN